MKNGQKERILARAKMFVISLANPHTRETASRIGKVKRNFAMRGVIYRQTISAIRYQQT